MNKSERKSEVLDDDNGDTPVNTQKYRKHMIPCQLFQYASENQKKSDMDILLC